MTSVQKRDEKKRRALPPSHTRRRGAALIPSSHLNHSTSLSLSRHRQFKPPKTSPILTQHTPNPSSHSFCDSRSKFPCKFGMMLAQAAGSRVVRLQDTAGCARAAEIHQRGILSSGGLRQVSWRWQQMGARKGFTGPAAAVKAVKVGGARCKAASIGEGEFEEVVLNSKVPVLVDFWADWCGPCKLVANSMDTIEKKYHGSLKVVKIETDPNPKLVEKYKVYGLPTLILFQNGEVVPGSRREGAISLKKMESMLIEVLPSLTAA